MHTVHTLQGCPGKDGVNGTQPEGQPDGTGTNGTSGSFTYTASPTNYLPLQQAFNSTQVGPLR